MAWFAVTEQNIFQLKTFNQHCKAMDDLEFFCLLHHPVLMRFVCTSQEVIINTFANYCQS